MALEQWTATGFLDHFADITSGRIDRSFGFILGAGASRQSGIPTGAELVDRWLEGLRRKLDPEWHRSSVEEWATEQHLGITGFQYSRGAAFYPQVFERCFGFDPEDGYADLEKVMENREPSVGYAVLSHILAETRHKVVITTNFDNLVAEALTTFTRSVPLVCGHHLLSELVRPRMRRPVITKVHGDLYVKPKNDPDSLSRLEPEWDRTLRSLLQYYTPVVVGYGGNDGSLMSLLESLPGGHIPGRIIWCYLAGTEPDARATALLDRLNGILLPILGFDELMLQLGARLEIDVGKLGEDMQTNTEQKSERFYKQIESTLKRIETVDAPESQGVRRAVTASWQSSSNDPWVLFQQALEEQDLIRRERLLMELLAQHPKEKNALRALADLRWNRSDVGRARRLYDKVHKLDPDEWTALNNYGLLLFSMHRLEEAEALLTRAVAMRSRDPQPQANLAAVLLVRGQIEDARRLAFSAWKHSPSKRSRAAVRAAYVIGIAARIDQKLDITALGRIKRILQGGFDRGQWPMCLEPVWTALANKLDQDDRQLYATLAAVLEDTQSMGELDQLLRWRAAGAINLNLPWCLDSTHLKLVS